MTDQPRTPSLPFVDPPMRPASPGCPPAGSSLPPHSPPAADAEPGARVAWLRAQIRYHEHRYFVDAAPEISDRAFDALVRELAALEAAHPELVTDDSPTRRVGGAVTSFAPVLHRVPMLSLENAYHRGDLAAWVTRVEKLAEGPIWPVVAELKIDGVSITLRYADGRFVAGATRGDGTTGDDVTANLRTIRSLPLVIGDRRALEVRGEVYLPRARLDEINRDRIAAGEEPFKNCRNLTAGTLKSLDPAVAAARRLELLVYGLVDAGTVGFASHFDSLEFLVAQGFAVNRPRRRCGDLDELMAFIAEIDAARDGLPFDIDGVVVKIDRLALWEKVGQTSKAPRAAIAYKYPQRLAVTRLESVTWEVGRSQLTPVANLAPVELGGTTVKRASLHNLDQIRDKGIRLGDLVEIEKAGYIIPYVIGPLPEQPADGVPREPIPLPARCPACDGPVILRLAEEGGATPPPATGASTPSPTMGDSAPLPLRGRRETPVSRGATGPSTPVATVAPAGGGRASALLCANPDGCRGVRLRRLEHFVKMIGIDNIGPQLLERLFDAGLVREGPDLFALTAADLLKVERMGAKLAAKILANLEVGREAPLEKVLAALGIPGIGEVTARALAKAVGALDGLLTVEVETLRAIEGIERILAGNIVEHLRSPANLELVRRLQVCLRTPPVETGDQVAPTLAGKTFVITGEAVRPREEYERLIKAHDGKCVASVSKKTTALVVGSLAGPGFRSSKLARAAALGIPVIDEFALERLAAGTPLADLLPSEPADPVGDDAT